MKSKTSPRMDRMLNLQVNMIMVNAILAIVAAVYLTFFESEQFGLSFFSIVGCAVLSFILNKIFNFLSSVIITWLFYKGDTEALAEEALEAARAMTQEQQELDSPKETVKKDINLKIKDVPSHYVGTFLDEPFYEWIDFAPVADESKIFRAHFEGTIDLEKVKEYTIPEGCILLPPGLLYKVSNV